MVGIARWKISPETRARFTQILDEAPRLGVDRDEVVAGGLPGLRALIALKQASESVTEKTRDRALAEVQDALRTLAHRKYPKLVSQFQARILALQGRGNDTEVAHVARGEMVVPRALQNRAVLGALRDAASEQGLSLDVLRVGSERNRINPETGAPEFGLMDWVSGLFKSDAASSNAAKGRQIQPLVDVNSESASRPSNESLEFDPNGPGIWGALLRHPLQAKSAYDAAVEAEKMTREKFPEGDPHNDEADAYRHALWSRIMTQSVGPDAAKAYTDAYERWRPNPEAERYMDLYNNQVGRSLPTNDGARSPQIDVENALKSGYLRKTPFDK